MSFNISFVNFNISVKQVFNMKFGVGSIVSIGCMYYMYQKETDGMVRNDPSVRRVKDVTSDGIEENEVTSRNNKDSPNINKILGQFTATPNINHSTIWDENYRLDS